MLFVFLFFVELLILFFLSREVTKGLSYLFYRITKSQKIMIYLLSFFFFPGTLIHPLALYLTAVILFVRVGKIEFVPKVMGEGVKMGSVEIGHADPIRRALIGMAPFFWGTIIILLILTVFQNAGGIENIWITILTGYVLFEISNTMFSSRKDMEGTLELFLAILVITIILYLIGVRFPQINPNTVLSTEIETLFKTGSFFLGVPLVIDFVFIALLKLLRRIHH